MRSIIISTMMKLTQTPRALQANAPRSSLARRPLRDTVRRIGLAIVFLVPTAAIRAEDVAIAVKIKNHQFIPAEIEIPAGEKRLLVIENQDPTAEEFESHALHREKIIPPNAKANVYVGPLKPGRYEFEGEFNEATAKGAVVAK